ncbi:UDP-glucose 4-epimerase GalE [Myroides marinus]|uniref:UDP-glucose 4-epimerase GalE n=1 Tax=Myroides marinus TaxID=703342 RepID=UPI002575CD9B|nr:UDP-glucose 4-epimerase GalE [Myroides marinus]MDM1377756.1 UDP-glucose 4-epimerase GalE [Myroides marinus]MDM1385040.1 UDP-glucose 4-epimerase GalE [Myroides marinus]MDM1392240.1 UDP-glucose 4-epimerase GalE [Myroides marinus]
MKKILVTGGLGYIGSHTVVELINSNYEVVIIDDLSNSQVEVLQNIKKLTGVEPSFYCSDLKDRALVSKVFEEHAIAGVIHFAAYKSVGESQQIPLDYYENNICSLINLLQEMKTRSVDNFIFSSSCTVYGQADDMPISEETPLKMPESCYGKTKQMGEEIIKDYIEAERKKATLLRYFNPIGAHPSGLLGELPRGIPNNLIPYVVQTAAGVRECLSIFGDDYPTEDGTAIRDYIYVIDLARAHVAALNKLLQSEELMCLDIYNLGTGKGTSVLEIVKSFQKINKQVVPFKMCDRRPGDIVVAYADASKAEKELNWTAGTSIEESLRTAWNWQQTLV